MSFKTSISKITEQRRALIKTLQDEFTTFSWGGVDAFETFGVFIINDKKGSLKFYNGPSFSNEYTKPQFNKAGGLLQGVSFNKQTISFNVGVYWISIQEYRQLINWLDPLKIDFLQFGFDKNYTYNVKLSKLTDSTRWIVGRENGEPRYYTELSLSFDIQGDPCAKGANPYEFIWTENDDNMKKELCGVFNTTTNEYIPSDLATPFELSFDVVPEATPETASEVDFKVEFKEDETTLYRFFSEIEYNGEVQTLFDVYLQNLTYYSQDEYLKYIMNIRYVSETGLLFLNYGGTSEKILNIQTRTDSGDFLVKSISSNKFFIPGQFDFKDFKQDNVKIKIFIEKTKKINSEYVAIPLGQHVYEKGKYYYENEPQIRCYPRTNLI